MTQKNRADLTTAIAGLSDGGANTAADVRSILTDLKDSAAVTLDDLGQEHLYIPATAMVSRTTSGAAAGTIELATNDIMIETFDFDSAADEFVQFSLQMPKSWNEGTLLAQFLWSHETAATNFSVAWAIQAMARDNDNPFDVSFGTAVLVNDIGGTADNLYRTAETAAITVAGSPTNEEFLIFQIYRDVSDAGDTLAVDARLHGVKIHWVKEALSDD